MKKSRKRPSRTTEARGTTSSQIERKAPFRIITPSVDRISLRKSAAFLVMERRSDVLTKTFSASIKSQSGAFQYFKYYSYVYYRAMR
jgi:hypothetical protein